MWDETTIPTYIILMYMTQQGGDFLSIEINESDAHLVKLILTS